MVHLDHRRILISHTVSTTTFVVARIIADLQDHGLDDSPVPHPRRHDKNCDSTILLPAETAKFRPHIDLAPSSVKSGELLQGTRGRTVFTRASARRTLLATLPSPTSDSQQSQVVFPCSSRAFTTHELVCSRTVTMYRIDFSSCWTSGFDGRKGVI